MSPLKEKSPTISRLELQATIIATHMKTQITEDSEIQPNNIYLWSDSKVVLNFIEKLDANFGSYIVHMVNQIRSNTDIKQLNYIPCCFSVADDTTKCMDIAKLQSDHQWFVGTYFLNNGGCPIDHERTKHEINAENKITLNNTCHVNEMTNIVKQANILCHCIIFSIMFAAL